MNMRSEFISDTVNDAICETAYWSDHSNEVDVDIETDNYYFELNVALTWERCNYHEWEDGLESDWDNCGELQGIEVLSATYIDNEGNKGEVPQELIDDFNRKYGE